ncbi:hypothetical protein CASFOL_004860 [Castilleja foliolosa]|uniref:Uncharacterized protein n=1 Tax=Castilleja foliolosa TaxID=1961234 RepID=A0ABD3EBY8_9LAMI
MEWPDFNYSTLQETLHGLFEMGKSSIRGWTYEENKVFENALAETETASPAFFETVASKIPWKSTEEIKEHYRVLVDDLNMIETGLFPVPDYQVDQMEANSKDENIDAKTRSGLQRRRGVPWTEEEHQLFLMGLNKYGKGDWRSISRYYVITKTPTQVASHAQKYFRRQTSSTPVDRRRPSIHDIQTVNPILTNNPMLHNNSFNDAIIDRNAMFFPMSNSSDDQIFDQTCVGQPGSYLISSIGEQQWG